MTAAWVAGTVRARAMARRGEAVAAAHELARAESATAALAALAASRDLHGTAGGDSIPHATRAIEETLLWNIRVLAGWLPAHGTEMLRLLAGWFEIANVEERLHALRGGPAAPPFALGAMATAWPRLAIAGSVDELRDTLATSAWGDPGESSARAVQLSMSLAWAERVQRRVPPALPWTLGGASLVVARERLARGLDLPEAAATTADRLLGDGWRAATTLPELSDSLPPQARWPLAGLAEANRLWYAEARWWRRLRADCRRLLAHPGFGPEPVIGAIGLLAADARLVASALAGVGRGADAAEVLDALA
jgi:hypothetical protein